VQPSAATFLKNVALREKGLSTPGLDHAQFFLDDVLLTTLSFHNICPFFSITCSLHHRRGDEQKAVVVVCASLPELSIKCKTFYTRKYLRGLGNLW